MPIYKADGKKDGLQKYKIRINYISDYGTPKQLTRIAYGSEAAKDLERQLINEMNTKGENSVKSLTVQELFDKYMESKRYEVRQSTYDKDIRNFRLYVQQKMANVRLNKLTVSLLQDWKQSVEEKGLSLKTRKHAYSIFRSTLGFAVKMEYLERNPLLKLGNFKDATIKKREMNIYTAKQFTKLKNVIKQLAEEKQENQNELSEWDFYTFFNIAFFTGMRKGEILALKWSDIKGSLLSVERSITQKIKGGDVETPPKNHSSIRTLQMPLPLIQALKEHRERQEVLEHFTEDYRICGGERCLRDNTLRKKNLHYAATAGLIAIRIHDYRHSHVSLLANEGINIQEIARRLGHARIEETWNTYSHLYPREEEKAIDVLNKIA